MKAAEASYSKARFEPGSLPNDIVTEDSAAVRFVERQAETLQILPFNRRVVQMERSLLVQGSDRQCLPVGTRASTAARRGSRRAQALHHQQNLVCVRR